eukprot:COSAG01_NODE_1257_length_11020_cov_5.619723_10_plen_99_part_00
MGVRGRGSPPLNYFFTEVGARVGFTAAIGCFFASMQSVSHGMRCQPVAIYFRFLTRLSDQKTSFRPRPASDLMVSRPETEVRNRDSMLRRRKSDIKTV